MAMLNRRERFELFLQHTHSPVLTGWSQSDINLRSGLGGQAPQLTGMLASSAKNHPA